MGRNRWLIVGCYVLPGSAAETEHISNALCHCPDGLEPILVGDININLSQPVCSESDKDLTVILVVEKMD